MSIVPMHNPETGKTADVHPDEVGNWKKHGWREAAPVAEVPPPPPQVKRETLSLKAPKQG